MLAPSRASSGASARKTGSSDALTSWQYNRPSAPIEAAPRSIRATIELALQPPAARPPDGEARGPYGGATEATATDAGAAQPAAPQP